MTMVFLVLQLEKCKSWDFSAFITAEPIPVINLHLHFSLSYILLALFLWRMLTNNRATESEGISRILRECYRQLNAHKFSNFEEPDNYLKIEIYQKFKQDEIDNMNSPKTMKEIEFVT